MITADEGNLLRLKKTGAIAGTSLALIPQWWEGDKKLDKPFTRKPEEYDEVNAEEYYFVQAKQNLLKQIEDYDTSDNVNSFILNGKSVWLAKYDRMSLIEAMQIKKSEGHDTMTLWFKCEPYTTGIDNAIKLMYMLELYALECYNVTAQHIAQVNAITDSETLGQFDITAGYPEKLNINI